MKKRVKWYGRKERKMYRDDRPERLSARQQGYEGGIAYNPCRERQIKGFKETEKKCNQIGIINESGFEKVNRVYRGFCCPTITARDYKDAIKVMKKVDVIGQMDNTFDNTFESANRVYDSKQCCPTIPTCSGGVSNQR